MDSSFHLGPSADGLQLSRISNDESWLKEVPSPMASAVSVGFGDSAGFGVAKEDRLCATCSSSSSSMRCSKKKSSSTSIS